MGRVESGSPIGRLPLAAICHPWKEARRTAVRGTKSALGMGGNIRGAAIVLPVVPSRSRLGLAILVAMLLPAILIPQTVRGDHYDNMYRTAN